MPTRSWSSYANGVTHLLRPATRSSRESAFAAALREGRFPVALEITPPGLASDIVDRGIVMAGGGSLVKGLDVALSQETSLPVRVDEDPLTCVVRGTGRILEDPQKYRSVLST